MTKYTDKQISQGFQFLITKTAAHLEEAMSEMKKLVESFKAMFKDLKQIEKPVSRVDPLKLVEFKIAAPTEQEIRELAYIKWEEAGSPDLPSEHFWMQALQELQGQ